jgi:hypothetical protein
MERLGRHCGGPRGISRERHTQADDGRHARRVRSGNPRITIKNPKTIVGFLGRRWGCRPHLARPRGPQLACPNCPQLPDARPWPPWPPLMRTILTGGPSTPPGSSPPVSCSLSPYSRTFQPCSACTATRRCAATPGRAHPLPSAHPPKLTAAAGAGQPSRDGARIADTGVCRWGEAGLGREGGRP